MSGNAKNKKNVSGETMHSGGSILRVRNIGVDTSLRDLIELFDLQHFCPHYVALQLVSAWEYHSAEALYHMSPKEAQEAQKWADGRLWRGKKLEAVVLD